MSAHERATDASSTFRKSTCPKTSQARSEEGDRPCWARRLTCGGPSRTWAPGVRLRARPQRGRRRARSRPRRGWHRAAAILGYTVGLSPAAGRSPAREQARERTRAPPSPLAHCGTVNNGCVRPPYRITAMAAPPLGDRSPDASHSSASAPDAPARASRVQLPLSQAWKLSRGTKQRECADRARGLLNTSKVGGGGAAGARARARTRTLAPSRASLSGRATAGTADAPLRREQTARAIIARAGLLQLALLAQCLELRERFALQSCLREHCGSGAARRRGARTSRPCAHTRAHDASAAPCQRNSAPNACGLAPGSRPSAARAPAPERASERASERAY